MTTPTLAERREEARDLRNELGALDGDEGEIVFQDVSKKLRLATIYSMLDGEEVQIPAYTLDSVLTKRLPPELGGGYMFTATKAKAPEFKLGEIKCFLHPQSPERAILDSIGLNGIVCFSAHLASTFAKKEHARNRHKKSWAAYQDFLTETKENEAIERAQAQMEAMRALAGDRAPVAGVASSDKVPCEVEGCGELIHAKGIGRVAHMKKHGG